MHRLDERFAGDRSIAHLLYVLALFCKLAHGIAVTSMCTINPSQYPSTPRTSGSVKLHATSSYVRTPRPSPSL